jgi:hypothetical protein
MQLTLPVRGLIDRCVVHAKGMHYAVSLFDSLLGPGSAQEGFCGCIGKRSDAVCCVGLR